MKNRIMLMGSVIALLILLVLCGCGAGVGESDKNANEDEGVYTSLSQVEDKRIGVSTGSIQEQQVEERFPHAKLFRFSSSPDALNALKGNKIDAFADSDILTRFMMGENPDLTYIDEPLSEGMKVSGIFPKTSEGSRLRDEYNAS
ncbi:MAG: transporter substrate-binding domain-containing protein [Atopobiaceae bacterium]|nr:transporter substrate-binding domain-containing protein [Atopobiaceae bacterium]